MEEVLRGNQTLSGAHGTLWIDNLKCMEVSKIESKVVTKRIATINKILKAKQKAYAVEKCQKQGQGYLICKIGKIGIPSPRRSKISVSYHKG